MMAAIKHTMKVNLKSMLSCVSLLSILTVVMYTIYHFNHFDFNQIIGVIQQYNLVDDLSNIDHQIAMKLHHFEEKHLRSYSMSTQWISRFGIISLCDKHDDMLPSLTNARAIQNTHSFENMSNGDIIYLYSTQLTPFIEGILPNITTYFSIILYDGDNTFPFDYNQYLTHKSLCTLFQNRFLLKLFAKNYANGYFKYPWITSEWKQLFEQKLSHIPLGMVYFDLRYYPVGSFFKFGHAITNSFESHDINIQKLRNDKSKILPIEQRARKVYVDYVLTVYDTNHISANDSISNLSTLFMGSHWVHGVKRKDVIRSEAYYHMKHATDNSYVFGKQSLNQYDLFVERSTCVFILAVGGFGMDSYRIWESLLFGHIVIVMSSPLDKLFIEHPLLPVVIIHHYNEINESMLQHWYFKYKDQTSLANASTEYALTNKYWIKYIRNKTRDAMNQTVHQHYLPSNISRCHTSTKQRVSFPNMLHHMFKPEHQWV